MIGGFLGGFQENILVSTFFSVERDRFVVCCRDEAIISLLFSPNEATRHFLLEKGYAVEALKECSGAEPSSAMSVLYDNLGGCSNDYRKGCLHLNFVFFF